MQRAGSGGHHNPIPTGQQGEDAEETTTPIPMGNQREDLKGIATSIPVGEQEDPEGTTTPIPTGKKVPGIRGAEALPGSHQHRAQGVWLELAGFPTRNDGVGICSRSIAWINLPQRA